MRLRHLHDWITVVGRVLRPDGSLSGGRFWCPDCDSVLDYYPDRGWMKAR